MVSLIKKGSQRHTLPISPESLQILLQFQTDFKILSEGKKIGDFVFTTEKNPNRAINTSSLTEELNEEFRKHDHFGKNVTTHSMRITMITDLLEHTPIERVKELIGHSSIGTTEAYKRGTITQEQLETMQKNLDKTRKTSFQEVVGAIEKTALISYKNNRFKV